MPARTLLPARCPRASQLSLLLLLLILTFTLPPTAHAQGLEVSGAWAHVTGDFGTDGFDVGAAWGFTKRFYIAGNYESTWDDTNLGNFAFTNIRAIAVHSHLQSALFGPRYFFSTDWTTKHRLNPFAEAQFGVSHLNQKVTQAASGTISASDSGFSYMLGGGLDYRLTSHFSARGNLDFLRTHLANE